METKNNKLNFNGQQFHIGIDVHKKNWKVTIRTNQMELKTFSMNPSPRELARHMKENYPGGKYYSVYEAGYSGYWISRELANEGIENIIVNPADVPTKSKERRTKTDKIDSRKLSRELESRSIEGIYIPAEIQEEIRSLCRLRYQLVGNQIRTKNRIKSLLSYYGEQLPENYEIKNWTVKFISYLKENTLKDKQISKQCLLMMIEELTLTQEKIKGIIKQLESISKELGFDIVIKNLISIPGISFITAITLYTEIIDINRFPSIDELSCFVGLVPSVYSSGDKESVIGITERHSKYLRNLLIEAAWIGIRKDPALTMKFNELTRRMSKQEAIIRIAKKMLNRVRHVWREKENYVFSLVA
jgi:transposase